MVLLLALQEQQHQRSDPVRSRSHRLQSAAVAARRAAGGLGRHRLHHEALATVQLPTGPETCTVQRHAQRHLQAPVRQPGGLRSKPAVAS